MTQQDELAIAYGLYAQELAAQKANEARQALTCPHCGCRLDVEDGIYVQDKLFTGHSCRGSELEKQAILKIVSILEDIAGSPDDYDLHKTACEIYQISQRKL